MERRSSDTDELDGGRGLKEGRGLSELQRNVEHTLREPARGEARL